MPSSSPGHLSWRGPGAHLAAAARALLLFADPGAALVKQIDEDVQQEQDADAVQVGEERLQNMRTQVI